MGAMTVGIVATIPYKPYARPRLAGAVRSPTTAVVHATAMPKPLPKMAPSTRNNQRSWVTEKPAVASSPSANAAIKSGPDAQRLSSLYAWSSNVTAPIAMAPVTTPASSLTRPKLRSTYNLLPFL